MRSTESVREVTSASRQATVYQLRARAGRLPRISVDRWLVAGAAAFVALLLPAYGGAAKNPHDETLRPAAADVGVAHVLVLTRVDMPGGFTDKGPSNSDDYTCRSFDPDLHRYVETAA